MAPPINGSPLLRLIQIEDNDRLDCEHQCWIVSWRSHEFQYPRYIEPMVPSRRLILLRGGSRPHTCVSGAHILTIEEFRVLLREGGWRPWRARYAGCEIRVQDVSRVPRLLLIALLVRLVCRGPIEVLDNASRSMVLRPRGWLRLFVRFIGDTVRVPLVLVQQRRKLRRYGAPPKEPRPWTPPTAKCPVLYIRSDLTQGLRTGGSVAHTAGVLNAMAWQGHVPVLVAADPVPTVSADIEFHHLRPESGFQEFPSLIPMRFNRTVIKTVPEFLGPRRPAFVYQRYSIFSYSGLALARRYGVPFVLEFNGSEVWISRNWGRSRLPHEAAAARAEQANLIAADLVVVVSEAQANDLQCRGIPRERILVSPNGVDCNRFSPEIDGSSVREKLSLVGKSVIGFAGTFGLWHGVSVLVDAFVQLLVHHPELRGHARLLLIGDGVTRPAVQQQIASAGLAEDAILVGEVLQEECARYLSACDVLVCPHIPNPDGSRFFGSPTKLFEYMAMEKGIVASDLDQIGRILTENAAGVVVRPGDVESLMRGLKKLLDDEMLRTQLAKNARAAALKQYTWARHTEAIIKRLKEVCD